jgi:hypothetical protein
MAENVLHTVAGQLILSDGKGSGSVHSTPKVLACDSRPKPAAPQGSQQRRIPAGAPLTLWQQATNVRLVMSRACRGFCVSGSNDRRDGYVALFVGPICVPTRL